MLNIVLFGGPGAGKGTQSEKILKKYNLRHISTGDLFRKHISDNSELGEKAKKFMDDGFLVPDQIVIDMVDHEISNDTTSKGFVFDGFPRTSSQALALDKLMNSKNNPILGMISLEVPFEVLKSRLLDRGKISGRTDDQSEEKIDNRINVYMNQTLPYISEYYKQQAKYFAINGVGSIDEIFSNICTVIDGFRK